MKAVGPNATVSQQVRLREGAVLHTPFIDAEGDIDDDGLHKCTDDDGFHECVDDIAVRSGLAGSTPLYGKHEADHGGHDKHFTAQIYLQQLHLSIGLLGLSGYRRLEDEYSLCRWVN